MSKSIILEYGREATDKSTLAAGTKTKGKDLEVITMAMAIFTMRGNGKATRRMERANRPIEMGHHMKESIKII